MATQVLGSEYKISGTSTSYAMRAYFYYTITDNPTNYVLTVYSGVRAKTSPANGISFTTTLAGTGQTTSTDTKTIHLTTSYKDTTMSSTKTWTWTKTTSAQTKTVTAKIAKWGNHDATGAAAYPASKSFTVPALKSYTVSYNANGGSGAPSSQTKYYGKALTLSTSKPTRTGYTFKGWATTQARANDGYIDYNSGGTVSADTNNALTLYAVWDLNYVRPKITNVSVERCLSDGTQDDEGTYALVTFDWAIDGVKYPLNAVGSLTVHVGTDSTTPTVSGQSGTNLPVVVGSGTFGTDDEYPVTITLSDTTEEASNTTVVTQTLTVAKFPIDISETGNEMGLMMAARSGQTLTIPRDSYIDNVNIWDRLYYADAFGAITGQEFADKKINSGTSWTGYATFNLPAGFWLVFICVQFATNNTGYRQFTVSDSNATSAGTLIRTTRMGATPGAATACTECFPAVGNRTYYVNVCQNSGAQLNVNGRYTAIRLGDAVRAAT